MEVKVEEERTAEQEVDADIARFDQFMVSHVDDHPLTQFEKAILKTYLRWKTHEDAAVPSAG